MATPLAAINAGATVEFVDCNRGDLCMSFFDDFEAQGERHRPKAAILVHIGGHIALESAEKLNCRANGIFLLVLSSHATAPSGKV